MKTGIQDYRSRMQRVLDHIDANLDGELDLETVSAVAAFSKFHFHRQFTATLGMSMHRLVQLARLKRAAERLAILNGDSITQIAMDAGYSPDSFARVFRKEVGQSPSSFRKSADWGLWLSAFGPLDKSRSMVMQINFEPQDVNIREVPSTPVAILEHRGDRSNFPETVESYRSWRSAAGLSPEHNATFMVFRSERTPADPNDYSVDLCAATDLPIEASDGRFKAGVIPGGRCAVIRYPGNTNDLEPAAQYLYQDWLPASGEEPRDFPIYSKRRLASLGGTSGFEVVLELYLPLK